MGVIPSSVGESPLSVKLLGEGLERINQGKVRDTYVLPNHELTLLQVATDRISIFDAVLPCTIPSKGEVLTALTVFWLGDVFEQYEHHLVSYGPEIDEYLPDSLQGNAELQACALVVDKLIMMPVECVVRGYLTGTGWESYQKTREVCGHKLPPGLHDGARLPFPIFTPTTKAPTGEHDEHIPVEEVRKSWPLLEALSLDMYGWLARYAWERGIILADTKLEFGYSNGDIILGDEVGTPDSSRYWLAVDWEEAAEKKRTPPSYDKQVMRDWGRSVGIKDLDPSNVVVPSEVIEFTAQRYHQIFNLLTHRTLRRYQQEKMGVVK